MYSVVPFLLLALLVLLPLHSTTPSLAHAPQSHLSTHPLCPGLLHLVFLPHLIITSALPSSPPFIFSWKSQPRLYRFVLR